MRSDLPQIEQIRREFDVDPLFGVVFRRTGPRRFVRGGEAAGSADSAGYIRIMVGGRRFLAHEIAFAIHHGRWPNGRVVHLDGSKTNNHPDNLREIARGVDQHNGRFRARARVNGAVRHIGYFDSEEAASLAVEMYEGNANG